MSTADTLFQIHQALPDEKPWTNLEAPAHNYEGEGDPQPFPQHARTNDPEVLALWEAHQREHEKFLKHSFEVLKLMTGNPEIKTVWRKGSNNTESWVTGVNASDIAESHWQWWKKPQGGQTAPYKKHSLYPKFAELHYKAPRFGGAPDFLWGEDYMGRPAFFEHEGYLYFGTNIKGYTAKNYPWWVDKSPWEPIKKWEWEKAKEELIETQEKTSND